MKTVIGRALKLIINSSDDAPILVKAFNESGYVADEDDTFQISEFAIPDESFGQSISPESVTKEEPIAPPVDPTTKLVNPF